MTGGVDEPDGGLSQFDLFTVAQQSLDGRHSATNVQSELCRHGGHVAVRLYLVNVEDGLEPPSAMNEGQTEGVVEMRVGLEDIFQLESMCPYAALQQLLFLPVPASAVQNGGLEGCLVPKQVGILLYRIESE